MSEPANMPPPPEVVAARAKLGPQKSAMIEAVTAGIAETLRPVISGIMSRLDAIEQSQKEFRYVGTWSASRSYLPGNFCSHSGGLWHCERASTNARPGDGDAWRLAVKSGQLR